MSFWNWLRRENPEDKVLLGLKDQRIEVLKESISIAEERLTIAHARVTALTESNFILTESNSILRKHRDLLEDESLLAPVTVEGEVVS